MKNDKMNTVELDCNVTAKTEVALPGHGFITATFGPQTRSPSGIKSGSFSRRSHCGDRRRTLVGSRGCH